MTTDYTALRRNLLAHYIRLAQLPGWGQYTRERLNQLAKDPQFADFPRSVREALDALPVASSSPTESGPSPKTAAA